MIYWERFLLGLGSGEFGVSLRLIFSLKVSEGGVFREKVFIDRFASVK